MSKFQESNMNDLMRNTPVFIMFYLIPMALTYSLPYFGSNSSLLNLLTLGFNPAFWLHLLAFGALIFIAYARGRVTGYESLTLFPFLAFVFDFVPVLNWIPFAPTMFHIIALTLGARPGRS